MISVIFAVTFVLGSAFAQPFFGFANQGLQYTDNPTATPSYALYPCQSRTDPHGEWVTIGDQQRWVRVAPCQMLNGYRCVAPFVPQLRPIMYIQPTLTCTQRCSRVCVRQGCTWYSILKPWVPAPTRPTVPTLPPHRVQPQPQPQPEPEPEPEEPKIPPSVPTRPPTYIYIRPISYGCGGNSNGCGATRFVYVNSGSASSSASASTFAGWGGASASAASAASVNGLSASSSASSSAASSIGGFYFPNQPFPCSTSSQGVNPCQYQNVQPLTSDRRSVQVSV